MSVQWARRAFWRVGPFHLATILRFVVLAVFVGCAAFFALRLQRDVVPDEGAHASLSEYFAATWGIPPDGPETYPYGSVQYKPYLYYWINGRLLNALDALIPQPGSWKILLTLRLVNVFYATLAVVFCDLLAGELGLGRWWRLLVVFLLTNTLMFVFLAGGVNYDNLTNLCCFAGIYFLIRVIHQRPFLRNSLAWLICILTGTLVKITALPLLAVTVPVWLVFALRFRRQVDLRSIREGPTLAGLAVLVALALLSFSLYGVNLLRFHAVIPSCTTLLTESQCEQNPVFVRDRDVYLAQKLPLADMFNGNVPDPLVWFDQYWSRAMVGMIYGAVGHKSVMPSELAITGYLLWLAWLAALAIRLWKKPSAPLLALAAIVLGYALILLQTNLSSELSSGFKHLGIQGRYFFPVIGGAYVLIVSVIARIPNRAVLGATLLVTLALFVVNSPLWMLLVPAPVEFPSAHIPSEVHDIRISDGVEVSQDFQSECLGALTQVEVLVAANDPLTARAVSFRLVDTTGQELVTEQVLRGVTVGEQTWLTFPLDSLRGTRNHRYRMTLTTVDGDPGRSLSLWNTRTNLYLNGDAFVDGVPTNHDLVFRYTCRVPLLAGWFH